MIENISHGKFHDRPALVHSSVGRSDFSSIIKKAECRMQCMSKRVSKHPQKLVQFENSRKRYRYCWQNGRFQRRAQVLLIISLLSDIGYNDSFKQQRTLVSWKRAEIVSCAPRIRDKRHLETSICWELVSLHQEPRTARKETCPMSNETNNKMCGSQNIVP